MVRVEWTCLAAFCLTIQSGRLHADDRPQWGEQFSRNMVSGGKVYLGTGRQILWTLAAGRELKVIDRIRMRDGIFCTPTAANGVLYVATRRHLYAVAK